MGCGSSTTVQTFENPAENKNYHKNRKSSAASSVKSAGKSKPRKGSTSSSSSSQSKSRKKPDDDSRPNSGSTKKTYTIQRDNSGKHTEIDQFVVPPADENENTQCATFKDESNERNESEVVALTSEHNNDEQFEHDELQKETFITGNYRREECREKKDEDTEETVKETREEKHERRAKEIEERRKTSDFEKAEEKELFVDLGLAAINIPQMEPSQESKDYTIDDLVSHNEEVGFNEWFKYGKKLYSWSKMLPIIKERMTQYAQKIYDTAADKHGYPIYLARRQGVSRKELKLVLQYCYIGNVVDLSKHEYLSRIKQDAEAVLEDGNIDQLPDYRDQLNRWIREYPNNPVYNESPEPEKDPNGEPFPLPADIQSDPSILRKWVETFEWDTELGDYWNNDPNIYTDVGDVHEEFASLVASHVDSSIPDLDLTIDGDVAWIQVELDLFKNDVSTEAQEATWKKRETRTNLENEAWLEKRREELYQSLIQRHEWEVSKVEPYRVFFDRIKEDWAKFQKLCEEEFVPKRNSRALAPVSDKPNTEKAEEILVLDNGSRPNSRESIRSKTSDNIISRNDSAPLEREKSNEVPKSASSRKSDVSVKKSENGEDTNQSDGLLDETPGIEKTDSGLELDTPDQGVNERRNSINATPKSNDSEPKRPGSRYSDDETPVQQDVEQRVGSRYSGDDEESDRNETAQNGDVSPDR